MMTLYLNMCKFLLVNQRSLILSDLMKAELGRVLSVKKLNVSIKLRQKCETKDQIILVWALMKSSVSKARAMYIFALVLCLVF